MKSKYKSKPDNFVIWIFSCMFEVWVMWSKHTSRDNFSQAVGNLQFKVNQTDCDQIMLQDNSVQAEVKSKSKPDNCVIWIFCCVFELWVMWSKHSSRDNSSQAVKAIEKSNGLWSQSKSKVDNFVFEFSVLFRNYERCDQNTLQGTILFRLRAI